MTAARQVCMHVKVEGLGGGSLVVVDDNDDEAPAGSAVLSTGSSRWNANLCHPVRSVAARELLGRPFGSISALLAGWISFHSSRTSQGENKDHGPPAKGR